jgi:hypothetical protein
VDTTNKPCNAADGFLPADPEGPGKFPASASSLGLDPTTSAPPSTEEKSALGKAKRHTQMWLRCIQPGTAGCFFQIRSLTGFDPLLFRSKGSYLAA